MKTCYTAIFGPYDELKEPAIITKGWRYVCFTDQDFKSKVWEIRKVPVMDCGPVKTARYYKIMFHKHIDTEFSLWVDGTFIININLDTWWKRFVPPFTAPQHPFDNCIYKDAQSCIESGKGIKSIIDRQVAFYKAVGIPKNNGLIASGILMRQNIDEVKRFCKIWWTQVEKWSKRDQIAWGYPNFLHPELVRRIQWNYQKERDFWHVAHLNKEYRKYPSKNQLKAYASDQRRKRDLEHNGSGTLDGNVLRDTGRPESK